MTTSRKPSRKSYTTAFVDQERYNEATAARQGEDSPAEFATSPNNFLGESGFGNESFFNRIGGMDGIMSGMTNIQKIYSAYKIIQPMLGLLGSFGPTLQTKSIQQQRKRQTSAAAKGRKKTVRRSDMAHR